MNHLSFDDLKHVVDLGSIFSVIASLFDKMPHIAAIVAAIWVFVRFYDYMRYVRPKIMKNTIKEDEYEE